MKLTVVLPFFNEMALLPELPATLQRVRAALVEHEVHLIAVDDGSTDGTGAALAAIEGLELHQHGKNRGVGAAMSTGLAAARGEAALVYDPDEPYPAEMLGPLVRALAESDIATLSPYHPEGRIEGVGFLRLFLSRGASWLYRRRLRSNLYTFTCAVRAYRVEHLPLLLPAPDDFTAAAALLARGLRAGLRVREVPATLRVRRRGGSKMRLIATIRSHLRLLRDLSVTAPRS